GRPADVRPHADRPPAAARHVDESEIATRRCVLRTCKNEPVEPLTTLHLLEVRTRRRRSALRLPGGLGDQLAHDRRAFAGDVPEPILVARLVLARDQSEIATDRFGIPKTVRVIHERGYRFGRADSDSGDATQLSDGGRLLRLMVPSQVRFNAATPYAAQAP